MAAKKTAAKKDKRSKKHRAAGKAVSNRLKDLRKKAEREFPRGTTQPERMSRADAAATIRELQARQINLEAQNEELRTVQKQAEAALRQSKHQLARLQEMAHLGSWELDLVNDQLSWSDEVYRIFGLQPQEFGATYEAFLERVHPDDRALVDEAYSGSIREGKDGYEIEHRVVKKPTGEIRYVHEKCEHFRDGSGKIIRSVGMVHDITERKHAAEQLEMLARFPSENPSPVLRIASDGMILYSNGPGSSLLEEWGRGVGQEAPKAWSEPVARALDSGQNIIKEFTCGKRIVSFVLTPVLEGEYVNLYGRDVTKERKAEQALQKAHTELEKKVQERTTELKHTVSILQQEVEQRIRAEETAKAERQRFNDVLETLPAYVCLLTPDYYMPFANRVFREWFGYQPDKKCYEFLFNRTEPCETCETYKVLKTHKPLRWEWTGPNGRNYDIFDFPFKDTDGSQLILEMGMDITEKKATEEELDKYRQHLEDLVKQRTEELARSNRDLEQFAYVASHDLQEPLRAVAGFVELLKRNLQGSLDAKTAEYMNFIVDGAMRMQSLISGLLEYSRVGTHGQRPEQTDSKAALSQAIANLRTSIEESGAEITLDDLPMVYFDGVQLTQLLQNLIGNAIKFRAERAPRIHISAAHLDDSWRFAVADNGIGIDPQYAERIFLIFQRLHSREKYSGTGIGLSICKKIVERHNGKIWVESKPGNGSTFYFTVPTGQ